MSPNTFLDTEPMDPIEHVRLKPAMRPQMTFFYQHKDADGDVIEDSPIFACNEQEAGQFGRFHKFIGSSDGSTYIRVFKELMAAENITGRTIVTMDKAREIENKAYSAEVAMAKKNKKAGTARRPNYQNVFFDDTIRNHKNGKQIMDSFAPPA